jgi:hypothetical protein
VYLKAGDILYVLFKGRKRVRYYESLVTLAPVEGLLTCKQRYLSAKEVRDLTKRGAGSLLEGYKAKVSALWGD